MNEYEEILREASDEAKRSSQSQAEKEEAEDARAKKILKEALKEAMAEDAGNKELKKEQIMKEPNTAKRQAMIKENIDLFRK